MKQRLNFLEVFYLPHFDFVLTRRTIRNISNKVILFNQTLRNIGNVYRDVSRYDVNYDEFKQVFRKPWEEEYKQFCIDRSKKRDQGRFCNCIGSKNTYIEYVPQTKSF